MAITPWLHIRDHSQLANTGATALWRALVHFLFAGFCLACLTAADSMPVVSPTAAPETNATASTAFLATLTEQERAWLRAHPVIRVFPDPTWPPIEFLDEQGNPSGMTKD